MHPLVGTDDLTLQTLPQHMVPIPAGSFDMGGEEYDDEQPIHYVSLDTFQLCRYPVTQFLWEEIIGENPSRFKGTQRPLEQVSWDGVQKFIDMLNTLTNGGYRLPTEAEWEYAARGGPMNQKLTYADSNKLEEVGWFDDNSYQETYNVGQKLPNALGLYDMCGNVEEWCQDRYEDYSEHPKSNPKEPKNGDDRVLRGGSWDGGAVFCRVAGRRSYPPVFRSYNIGFRLARSL